MSDTLRTPPASPFSADARAPSRVKHRVPATECVPVVGDLVHHRYRVEQVLGKGQFGYVFLVRHVLLGRQFAMKVMRPKIAKDAQWVERFREEARQTSALGHEHIVFVTDFDRCPRYGYFFIMEHLKGETLASILKRRVLIEPSRVFRIIYQACDALAAMHDVGVVHRDLKPSNVMVCEREGEECIKLLDFGIASKVFEASVSRKLYGTPAYMAPEQTRTMNVDGRADQFSLATILYQLLCGHRPWRIKRWADASTTAREGAQVPPVSELRVHDMLTPELDAVLARALALDPKTRWEDMRTFAYALSVATGTRLRDVERAATSSTARAPHHRQTCHSLGELSSLVMLMDQDSLAHLEADAPEAPLDGAHAPSVLGESTSSSKEDRALISVTFRTNDRYLREWCDEPSKRGGLGHGEVELKTPRLYAVGEAIDVRVVLEERGIAMALCGEVIHVNMLECERVALSEPPEGEVPITTLVRHGATVRLDEESRKRLSYMARELAPSALPHRLDQKSMVRRRRALSVTDELTPVEAFLISRLTEPMSVEHLGRLFSSPEFEAERVLVQLVHRGYVEIEGGWPLLGHEEGGVTESLCAVSSVGTRTTGERHALKTSSEYPLYGREQVEHVLELVRFFKRTGKEDAAIETLQRAIEGAPTEGEFYHQLALLYARGDHAPRRALRAIDTALELKPRDATFLNAREYIQTLYRRYKSER